MMRKTESIWLNPVAAYEMWIEVWTAWYVAALTCWMPQPLSGRSPVAGADGGAEAGQPPALAPIRDAGGEAGGVANKAANGSIARQAVNGQCAW
jgi:hypothetical protein